MPHIADPVAANPVIADAEPSAFSRPSGILGALYSVVAFFLEEGINAWVHITGKRVRNGDLPWLAAPVGEKGRIGGAIYARIAQRENLESHISAAAGLIPDFDVLRGPSFDPSAIRPEIRHFYEHAAQYHLDVWTEVSLIGRFFLWLLVEFISRRMDQLNFPISSLEVARGMSSQIVQLADPQTNAIRYTGWLRRLKSSGHVIYAGLYSTARIPGEDNPCVKVTFPCRGTANVYLKPVQHHDGSFGLDSSGSAFGRSGFYRIVASGPEHRRVRYVKTLHELFHVYVDAEGILRTDHKVSLLGITIIRLHYKMTLLPAAPTANEEQDAAVPVRS